MEAFQHTFHPGRVLFGPGSIKKLSEEIKLLNAERVLFCCTPGRRKELETIIAPLDNFKVGVCDIAEQYVPAHVAKKGQKIAKETNADCVVSYGGGTSVGLAKAIALKLEIPIISAVTTYSGSEMTDLQAILTDGKRIAYQSPSMLPKTVIYDAEQSMGVPLKILIPSGVNGIAHGVEAFYSQGTSPVNRILAGEGIKSLSSALRLLSSGKDSIKARGDGFYGAWLCGVTLCSAGVALHHKAAHVLGNTFGLEHSLVHSMVLPHSVAYNRAGISSVMEGISAALGDKEKDAAQALYVFISEIGIPTALKSLGMPKEGISIAAQMIAESPYPNPVPIEFKRILRMVENAWEGHPPDNT